jgi:hypothetical protein
MTRTALALLAAAGALLLSGAAQAKAPPDGIDVCGATACTHLAFDAAERFWIGTFGPGGEKRSPPAPFYVLRWHWAPSDAESAYLMPSAPAIRWNSGNGHPSGWSGVDAVAAGIIAQAARGIDPYPTPTLTRVTVGGRVVADPESYARLLNGRRTFALVNGPWLRVTFESATASPWTDGSSIVRLSRRHPYVSIDGFLYRIPRSVAVRARKAQPLD